jgi:hypothetical protein
VNAELILDGMTPRSCARRRLPSHLLVLLATLGFASAVEAQDSRRIAGSVLAASDSARLARVEVDLVGGSASAVTDTQGRFTLAVPLGPVRLAIRRIGIAPDTIAVAAGQDSVVIFARVLAVELDSLAVLTAASAARARFDTLAQPSIVTLSTREIARAPGVFEPDLMRTIQLLPGTVARNDYSTGYNVRGGETDQNLVQLDGITVFNPSHVGGLFSAFDINAVERADFLTGGFPASYSGRLSSVLDVTLRAGTREGVKGSGAISLLSSKLLVEGPAGPATFLLSARRSYADQVVKVLTSETLPYAFTDLMGKIDLPYGNGGDLSVTGYWGRDALSPNLVPAGDGTDALDLGFRWGNRLVGLHWRQPIGDGGSGFEQRLSVSEFSSRFELTPDLARFDNLARLMNAQSVLTLKPGGAHDLSVGVGAERYRMTYDIDTPGLGDAFAYSTRFEPTVLAGFIDEQWHPDPSLLVRGGVRVEKVDAASFAGVSPRVALKLFLTPDRALTASAGRYHQAVESQRDQEVPISIYEFWVGANDQIPVARSDQLVLGFEQWMRGVDQLSVEAYYKTFRNLVTPRSGFSLQEGPAPVLGVDAGTQFDPVKGYAYGLDVLLRRHVGKVSGWIAYSFVKAMRESLGAEYPPSHDRRHTLNVVLQAPGPLGSEMGVRWGLGSSLPYTAPIGQWQHLDYRPVDNSFGDGQTELIGGPQNGARYPHYSRLDASLHWQKRAWGVRLEPYFEVVNLYNRRNVFAYFIDTHRLDDDMVAVYQLPMLATFGVGFSW